EVEALRVLAQRRIEQEDGVFRKGSGFFGLQRRAEASVSVARAALAVPAADGLHLGVGRNEREQGIAAGALLLPGAVIGQMVFALALLRLVGTEDGLLALGGVGVEAELQLLQFAVSQREAIDGATLADGQQFLVGNEDAIVALGRNREDTATEEITAGVFE